MAGTETVALEETTKPESEFYVPKDDPRVVVAADEAETKNDRASPPPAEDVPAVAADDKTTAPAPAGDSAAPTPDPIDPYWISVAKSFGIDDARARSFGTSDNLRDHLTLLSEQAQRSANAAASASGGNGRAPSAPEPQSPVYEDLSLSIGTDLDNEVRTPMEQMQKHLNQHLAGVADRLVGLENRVSAYATQARQTQEQMAQEQVAQIKVKFDSALDKLGLEKVIGTSANARPGSPQRAKRDEVYEVGNALADAHQRTHGRLLWPFETYVAKAARASLGDEFGNIERERTMAGIAQHNEQAISRPTPRSSGADEDRDVVNLRNIEAIMAKSK